MSNSIGKRSATAGNYWYGGDGAGNPGNATYPPQTTWPSTANSSDGIQPPANTEPPDSVLPG